MCAGVTKGASVGNFISKKIHFYKAVQSFLNKIFYMNLLINIVYYVYIDLLYTSIYQIKQSVLLSFVFIVLFLK